MNEELVKLLNNLYEIGQFRTPEENSLIAYVSTILLKQAKKDNPL